MKILQTEIALKHDHIVMLDEVSGVGMTSIDKDHSHEIRLENGQWVMQPGSADGHVHEGLLELKKTGLSIDEEDDDIIKDCLSMAYDAWETTSKSVERGRESKKYYYGDQWLESDKAHLEKLQRACLTINLTERNVDELCGIERQNRGELKYLPTEKGDQRFADILNILSKHIMDRCGYERERSQVFLDIVTCGRGLYNIYLDKTKNLEGEIVIERFQWDGVWFGQHEKSDLTDCDYLVKHKMYSKAKLGQLFGEAAAKRVQKKADEYSALESTKEVSKEVAGADNYEIFGKTISAGGYPMMIGDQLMINSLKKEYRLMECWRREYKDVPVLVIEGQEPENLYGIKKKDVSRLATITGVTVVTRTIPIMRVTKLCGGEILSDSYLTDIPGDNFLIVPVYCKRDPDSGEFYSKIDSIKDVQDEINKRHSQAIDIGNKMVSFCHYVDQNTFRDNRELNKFKTHSSSPGGVYEVKDVTRLPGKSEGIKFPGELVELMKIGGEMLSELINVRSEPPGANTSGQLMLHVEKMKLTGNNYLFENMAMGLKQIGRIIPGLIQEFYSAERIMRIINAYDQQSIQKMAEAGQPDMSQFTVDEIQNFLDNANISDYDMFTDEATWSPSIRQANYMILSELVAKGAQIPPEVLFEFADLPEDIRQNVLQKMAEASQAAEAAAKRTSDTEIDKTLIAHGQIPPAVQARIQQEEQQISQPQQPGGEFTQ